MINHCDQNCETYTFLNTTPAIRYKVCFVIIVLAFQDHVNILIREWTRPGYYSEAVVGNQAMALLALIPWGYSPDIYQATGIFPGDLECSMVSVKSSILLLLKINVQGNCLEVTSMTINDTLQKPRSNKNWPHRSKMNHLI